MKISIYLRNDGEGNMTLRFETKCESLDTPRVHAWGHQLIKTIESGVSGSGDRK